MVRTLRPSAANPTKRPAGRCYLTLAILCHCIILVIVLFLHLTQGRKHSRQLSVRGRRRRQECLVPDLASTPSYSPPYLKLLYLQLGHTCAEPDLKKTGAAGSEVPGVAQLELSNKVTKKSRQRSG